MVVWFAYYDGAVYFLAHAREHGRGTDWYRSLVAAGEAAAEADGHRFRLAPQPFPPGVDAREYTVDLFTGMYGAAAG